MKRTEESTDLSPSQTVNAPGSAHLTAFLRAVESERPDALFQDTYARLLAGPEGEEYAQAEVQRGAWGIAVRTRVYDEIILKTLAQNQVDTVLNLAAGFDTRPYRLALPPSLFWIEVDLPTINARKDEILAEEQPACKLERVSLDIEDRAARKAFLGRISKQANNILVITEGLIGYLQPERVAELAADLHAGPAIHWWLTELPPAYILQGSQDGMMKFAPSEGIYFFRDLNWDVAEFRSLIGESHRLKRTMPLAWVVRILTWASFLASSNRSAHSHDGGFLLLKKSAPQSPEKRRSRARRSKRKRSMSNNHLSENSIQARGLDSRWLTLQQLTEYFHQDWDHAEDPDAWLRLGSYQGQPVYLSHDRARRHVLLVGAGASGSTSQGLASFWQHFHDPRQSLVFFDPTAELKRLLVPRLSETHEIWEIAPEALERSLKYNPLDLVAGAMAETFPNAEAMQGSRYAAAYSLASVYSRYMLPALPAGYPSLSQLAQNLVTACALHLTATHTEPSFQSLPALLLRKEQLLPYLSASLDRQVREIVAQLQTLSDDYLDTLTQALAWSASRFAQFQAHDDIQRLTARNEIDFASLLRRPIALFYTLPPFHTRDWQLITALLYDQLTTTLVQAWSDRVAAPGEREATGEMQKTFAPQGIRIVVDQPEVLGALPKLEQHVEGWMNSAANIALVMAIREHSVLTELYGTRAHNLPGAFETHLILPGVSLADCNFYAARYGYTPALVDAGGTGDQARAAQDDSSHPLFTPMRLSKLKSGRALLCPLDLPPATITYP